MRSLLFLRRASILAAVSLSSGSLPLAAQTPAASPAASHAPPRPPIQPLPTPPLPRTAENAVTPVDRNPIRHAQFLARTKEGKIDLLFLGDSITDGWPRNGEWTWLKFAPYNPADFGVSGERTEDVLWRITHGELDGITPKLTVLMIGTNNIGQHKDEKPEWTAAGIKKVVETIHAKLPQTKVLLLAVFPRNAKAAPVRAEVDAINAEIAKLDDGKTTRYLDIGHVFLDGQGEIPHDVMADGLHPTAKGYELWYDAMKPMLDEMMK